MANEEGRGVVGLGWWFAVGVIIAEERRKRRRGQINRERREGRVRYTDKRGGNGYFYLEEEEWK